MMINIMPEVLKIAAEINNFLLLIFLPITSHTIANIIAIIPNLTTIGIVESSKNLYKPKLAIASKPVKNNINPKIFNNFITLL